MTAEQQLIKVRRQRNYWAMISAILLAILLETNFSFFSDFFDNKLVQPLPKELAIRLIKESATGTRLPQILETKSVFFSKSKLDALTKSQHYFGDNLFCQRRCAPGGCNPISCDLDSVGISFYFGEYDKEIISALNSYWRINGFPETIDVNKYNHKETLIAVPSYLYHITGTDKDTIATLNLDVIKPENLGKLCPDFCDDTDLHRQ